MSTVNGFQVGSETLKYNYESLENYNTPEFSTTKTYAVGDYVIYQGKLYKCTTAVTTAGSWSSSNWALAVLSDDVSSLNNVLSDVDNALFYVLKSSDFTQGAYNPNSVQQDAASAEYLYYRRIGFASTIKLKAGSKVVYNTESDNIFIRVYANKAGTNQTPLQQSGSDWNRGNGSFTLEYDGYITINLRHSNDSQIAPQDYDKTIRIIDPTTNLAYEFNALTDVVDGIYNQVYGIGHFDSWSKGTFTANGNKDSSGNGAVSKITSFINTTVVRPETGSRFIVAFYNGANAYLGKVGADGSINQTVGDWKFFTTETVIGDYAPENASGFLICLLPTDGTTITVDNVSQWANEHSSIVYSLVNDNANKVKDLTDRMIGDISDYCHSQFLVHMTHNGAGGYGSNNNRNAITQPLHFLVNVSINCSANRKFAYQLFDGFETGSTHMTYASGWLTNAIIPAGSYWCMIVSNVPESETNETTQDDLVFSVEADATDIYYRILTEHESEYNPQSYVIGADSIRNEIKVNYLGMLTYPQSFCIYNGNYYSTDGNNIGIQDSSFNAISTKALVVGHGNSFQRGSNGKAYISGWNDQKIYVVDMETLELDSEITLPTIGYTTAVVDDLNGIAYIFQRDSYPETVVNYNFIVYDYQNQQIKSTRVINAFSAMQSADYYNGRIAVLWGLGTNANPSGMAIYNTVGDILAEFTVKEFKNAEPEGVYFDRKTGELTVSVVSKRVYQITHV